jgi:integrase
VAADTARFEAKVDRSGEHHLWLGAHKPNGTGQLRVDGKLFGAPHVAWVLAHGTVPAGSQVIGCVGEPGCVRIDHLSLRKSGSAARATSRASAGAGSKREVRPGVWKLTVVVGRDDHGRPQRAFRTIHGSTREATKALAAFVTEIGAGDSIPRREHRRQTVAEIVEGYLHFLEDDKGRKHSTLVRYRTLWTTWLAPTLGGRRAEGLLPEHLERTLGIMRRAGQSASSIHQAFTVLNGAFKWAKRNRRISRNPMLDVEKPQSIKATNEIMPPDIDALLALLAAAFEDEFEFGVACHLGAVTGMRRGELAGLQWQRVDLDAGQILVEVTVNDAGGQVVIDNFTKTRRARWVGIDEHTGELLADLHQRMTDRAEMCDVELVPDAFVFSHSPDGSAPVRPEYLTRRMRRLRTSLGLDSADFDATLHSLRHWTQTTLNEAGFNPKQVAQRGGHTEHLMNKVYVHRTKGADQDMTAYVGSLLAGDLPARE